MNNLSQGTIKIRNNGRMMKKECKQRRASQYCLTPPKYTSKNSMYNKHFKYCKKFGYDYDPKQSLVLRQLQQNFKNKLYIYLGSGQFVKKIDRKQKHKRKQQLDFEIIKNPVQQKFDRLNKILLLQNVREAFNIIKQTYPEEDKKINRFKNKK